MNFFRKSPKQPKTCQVCKKEFNIIRPRHKCKRCQRNICSDCGKGRIKVITFDPNEDHKVCTVCEKEHNFQTEFIATNQAAWGKLSTTGRKWMEVCYKNLVRSPNETYAEYLALANNPQTKYNDFKIIDRDVLEGRSNRVAFNYSLQDFLYYNQKDIDEKDLKEAASNVLKAYCMKFPTVGYTQGMGYVTVFLLTLLDEESVFWIWAYLVTSILPNNFYASSRQGVPLMGYQQERYLIFELAKKELDLDEDLAEKVQSFMEINGPAMLVPLLVNYLSFEVLYEAWNEMITTQSFIIFRKVVIKMIELLLPMIEKKSPINPPDAQARVIKLFTIEEFRQAQQIEISETRIKELEEIFKTDYSLQWMSKQSHIYHTLHKATHFSKKEIIELQQEFKKHLEPYSPIEAKGSSDTQLQPYEINIEDFKNIIIEVASKDQDKKEFLQSFDLEQMFKVFDVDKSGKLDFKEFLFSLSMLMRGSLNERVQFAFRVFDIGEKGFLTAQEYEQFLKSVIKAAMTSNQGNLGPFFEDDLKKFEDAMSSLIGSRETVTFIDMKKDLLAHDFLKYCEMSAETKKYGESIDKATLPSAESPNNSKAKSYEYMNGNSAITVSNGEDNESNRSKDSLDSLQKDGQDLDNESGGDSKNTIGTNALSDQPIEWSAVNLTKSDLSSQPQSQKMHTQTSPDKQITSFCDKLSNGSQNIEEENIKLPAKTSPFGKCEFLYEKEPRYEINEKIVHAICGEISETRRISRVARTKEGLPREVPRGENSDCKLCNMF